MHPSRLSELVVKFSGTPSLSHPHHRNKWSEHTVGIHVSRTSAKHLWRSGGIRENLLVCLSACVSQLLRTNVASACIEENRNRHVRCNFVVMRYGGVEADFVRVSTMVCLNAHIMQKLFLTRPDDIHM